MKTTRHPLSLVAKAGSLALAALLATACTDRANPPPASPVAKESRTIRDAATDRDIGDDVLMEAMTRADAVLLGELHDNAAHHRLQAWVANRLVARGRRIVVAFEMIDDAQRDALDAFLAGRPQDATGLGRQLAWEKSGWPDWAFYRPIADAALRQPNPPASAIRPANLPLDLARNIARAGPKAAGLDTALAKLLREAPTRDSQTLAVHVADIGAAHCGMLPDSAAGNFALAQYARDDAMARSIVAAHRDAPDAAVLLIAGNGHVRKDVGVPLHLARLAPGFRVLSIGAIEETAPLERRAMPFDYAWLTPPSERGNPCAAFKQRPAG